MATESLLVGLRRAMLRTVRTLRNMTMMTGTTTRMISRRLLP